MCTHPVDRLLDNLPNSVNTPRGENLSEVEREVAEATGVGSEPLDSWCNLRNMFRSRDILRSSRGDRMCRNQRWQMSRRGRSSYCLLLGREREVVQAMEGELVPLDSCCNWRNMFRSLDTPRSFRGGRMCRSWSWRMARMCRNSDSWLPARW